MAVDQVNETFAAIVGAAFQREIHWHIRTLTWLPSFDEYLAWLGRVCYLEPVKP